MADGGTRSYLRGMDSREELRLELTEAIETLRGQIEMRSIGSAGRRLVIREVQATLDELRQALADLDAEDAEAP